MSWIRRSAPARLLALALVPALALPLAGCDLLPAPYDPNVVPLTVDHGLKGLDVVVVVNGRPVDLPAGMSMQAGTDVIGAPPWAVEVRTATSGRLLTRLDVPAGAGTCADDPDGAAPCAGLLRVVDLSCGRLVVYVSADPPSLPAPMPGAGAPGDCAP
ncbi:MAG TPA: hypothetical protein VFY23_10155 [Candidatus Limnocylindrales bacterium]|nr:hypothetical protein [Candidatus Limnocylindrales bacterium]